MQTVKHTVDIQETKLEILVINLTKDSSFVLHSIHSPRKPYSSLVLKILSKKSAKLENSRLKYSKIPSQVSSSNTGTGQKK